jgi:hypothetical protein
LIEAGPAGQAQPQSRPEAIKAIDRRPQQGPTGGGIEPAQADQGIGLSEHSHIAQDGAIGGEGMDAAHGLPIADATMEGGVVPVGVDVDEGQAGGTRVEALIAGAQKANLAQAERTTAVVKDCKFWHGYMLRA